MMLMKKSGLLLRLLICSVLLSANSIIAQDFSARVKNENNFYKIKAFADDYFKDVELHSVTEEVESGKEREYIDYKRWEYFNEHRINADGTFPDPLKQFEVFKALKMQGAGNRTSGASWENISNNIAPIGRYGVGKLSAIAFHPTDTNIIYVGAPKGGIWRSNNGGQTWVPIGDNLPMCSVGSIIIDHSNPQNIFVSLGESDLIYPNFGIGIYHSTDGGVSWFPTSMVSSMTDNVVYWKMRMDPTNSNIIYSAQSNGFWKSVDAGITWQLIKAGGYYDFEFKPFHSNTIYICDQLNSSNVSEVHRSTDGGSTWTTITNFNTTNLKMRIAVTPADSNFISVAYTNNAATGPIYNSYNGGATFNQIGTFPDGAYLFEVSPTNRNHILVGNLNNYKSTNGGMSWTMISVWNGGPVTVHADNRCANVNPINSNYIYIGNDGGLFRYNLTTGVFNDLSNGLIISQFYSLANSQQDSVFVAGGTQDNAGFMRIGMNNWAATNLGGDVMVVAINYANDSVGYHQNWGRNLSRSRNRFGYYQNITPNATGGAWVSPYLLDKNTPTTIIAGYHELMRSTDEGDHWTRIDNNQLPNSINTIDIAKSNSNCISYSCNNYLSYTNDLGANWISNNAPDSVGYSTYITAIAFHPFNENKIFVTKDRYSDHYKVFSSTDHGITWTNESYNLPNIPINCMIIDEQSDSANVDMYIGTDYGVFFKRELDTEWAYFGSGLPNSPITDLEIFYPTKKLRASTFGRGIYEVDMAAAIIQNVISPEVATFDVQLMANPVGEEINLTVFAVENNLYHISLIDLQGRVLIQDSRRIAKGFSRQQLNIGNLSSGNYILQLSDSKGAKKTLKVVKN